MAVVSGVRAPQPGVGTFSVPQFVSPFRARAQKYLNMAIANHLNAHVMSMVPLLDADLHLGLTCPYRWI